jgi:hypothetical protein
VNIDTTTGIFKNVVPSYYKEVIDCIDLSSFPIKTTLSADRKNLYIRFYGITSVVTKQPLKYLEFKRPLLNSEDKKEIEKFIYWSLQNFILHEVAECFIFNGNKIYDPHNQKDSNVSDILPKPDESWVKERLL